MRGLYSGFVSFVQYNILPGKMCSDYQVLDSCRCLVLSKKDNLGWGEGSDEMEN